MKKFVSLLLTVLMICGCMSAGFVALASEPEPVMTETPETEAEEALGERVQITARLTADQETFAIGDDVTFTLELTNESAYILSGIKVFMFNNADFTIVSNEAEEIDAFKPFDTVTAKIAAQYTPANSGTHEKFALITENLTHFFTDMLTLMFGFLSPFTKNVDYAAAQVGGTKCQLTVWAFGYAEEDCEIFTVDFNCGDEAYDTAYVAEGRCVSEPAAPLMENAIFAGWFTDSALFNADTLFDFDAEITEDTVLYAGFIELGKDADGDGLPDVLEKLIGTSIYLTDTDEDGETDYDELMLLGTDPADAFNAEELSDLALALKAALEAALEAK